MTLAGIAEEARARLGAGLVTAMRFDAASMTVRRVFSSNEAAYPVGGSKPKRNTAWGRHVLEDKRVFVGEGEAAIRAMFDDADLILGLGLRSIVNVPLLRDGACIGTLNVLVPRPRWQPGEVEIVKRLAGRAVAAMAQ
jgi:GAF domain-containing protein